MMTKAFATIAAALLISIQAGAEESVPAWREAAFVMEEVVATAPRTNADFMHAWQQPGFVMEEIVVSAPQIDRENLHAAIRQQLLMKPIAVAQFSRG